LGLVGPFDHKNRPDQIRGAQACFLDHLSDPVPASQTSQSGGGIGAELREGGWHGGDARGR
jgi:hypothetical protein